MFAGKTTINGVTFVKGSDLEYTENWTCENVGELTRVTIDGQTVVQANPKFKLTLSGVGECLPTCDLKLGEIATAKTQDSELVLRLSGWQYTYCKWKFTYTWRFDFLVESEAT